jgi:hypothetical protein
MRAGIVGERSATLRHSSLRIEDRRVSRFMVRPAGNGSLKRGAAATRHLNHFESRIRMPRHTRFPALDKLKVPVIIGP